MAHRPGTIAHRPNQKVYFATKVTKRIAIPLGVVIIPNCVLVGFRFGAFHPCRLKRFCAFTRRLTTFDPPTRMFRNTLMFVVSRL